MIFNARLFMKNCFTIIFPWQHLVSECERLFGFPFEIGEWRRRGYFWWFSNRIESSNLSQVQLNNCTQLSKTSTFHFMNMNIPWNWILTKLIFEFTFRRPLNLHRKSYWKFITLPEFYRIVRLQISWAHRRIFGTGLGKMSK